ncbi:ROK family protein [Vagococcus elongatus]|uniref:N-acetylmannosamine kinase n=1 Tax=Vagococcus elongatus TaxID=180344 RepID=A0A430B1B7_9ENTE|nr:ROK family protein [Vagococcus elongatus]RSU14089.1 hypothetical protein CBF29_04185 [Vagococcus elongatus]
MILAFDIGGSAIKYGLWNDTDLVAKGNLVLPDSWEEMKQRLVEVYQTNQKNGKIEGVAFSAPGLVNENLGQIQGVSAVPYIHNFPIIDELSSIFGVPVTMENDANCAALAEAWLGAAKDSASALFVVVGSGVGGSIIFNGQLYKGSNLFGGEFGYMKFSDNTTWSEVGSWVKTVAKYNNVTEKKVTGKEMIELVKSHDLLAVELFERFTRNTAVGIYNLLVAFDPGLIVIGGGISADEYWMEQLKLQLKKIMLENQVTHMTYDIKPCVYRNDANLVGAVYHHINTISR